MRGKPALRERAQMSLRITPAYAGKTHASSCWPVRQWDHPRVCGENASPRTGMLCGIGSPPRMRGKLPQQPSCQGYTGITPAYAGKTTRTITEVQHEQDHPRVCGENPAPSTKLEKLAGSPPRMRGKQIYFAESCLQRRITPAYAGKTHTLPAFP